MDIASLRHHRACRAIVALALLASLATAASRAGIEESADVSSLALVRTRVTFHLQGAPPARESLEAVCRRLADAVSCIPSSVATPAGADVTFNVDSTHALSLLSAEGEGPSRLVLLSRLRPLQFSLGTGFGDMTRRLSIRYPSHTTVIDDVSDTEVTATVPLELGRAGELAVPAPSQVPAGDVLRVSAPAGDLCVFAILDGSSVASSRISPGCRAAILSTAGLSPSRSYRLLAVSVSASGVRRAVHPLPLSGGGELLPISFDRDAVVVGDPFTLTLGSRAERCTVTIEDASGHVADRLELTDCERVPVGTSSGMGPGQYVVRVEAVVGGKRATAARAIELRSSGLEATSLDVEKGEYLPGETARIHVDTPGDYCTSGIYNMDNIKVGEDASFGCGTYDMRLDEALPPGMYLIKTEVFERGALKAVASSPIQVSEWRPRQESAQSAMCTQGFIAVDEHRVQCVSAGEPCVPSSASTPFCVCFTSGDPVAVCEYGQLCGTEGCGTRPSSSPFVIVHEPGGACLAKRGADTLACIEVGEICGRECLCLGGDGSPLSTCTEGQACQPDGCQEASLRFEAGSRSADHARADELANGVTVAWSGPITFQGRLLEAGEVGGRASLGGLESDAFEASFANGNWTARAALKGELAPGVYALFLDVEHGGYTHLIRAPFEVWHAASEGALSVTIEHVTPRQLASGELSAGTTVQLSARVLDSRGADVTYLPQDAFTLRVGGVEAQSVGAEHDSVSGLWTLVGDLRGAPDGSSALALTVDHLGRRGAAQDQVSVLERVPLSVRILRVDPGTRDKPLFHMLSTLGFDLDVFLQVRGADRLAKESFDIRISGLQLKPEDISYIVTSLEGTRVHLANVRICPPERPNSLVPLVVGVSDSGQTAADTTTVLLKMNPGDWDNVAEARC